MNKIWELLRISDKKNRSIITNHIPITFLCIKFYCESSRISFRVCTSFFSSNCRKSQKYWSFLTFILKKMSFTIFSRRVCNFKVSMSSSSLGMNYSFRNPFSIEFSNFINILSILHKDWSKGSNGKRILSIINWGTPRSGPLVLILIRRHL